MRNGLFVVALVSSTLAVGAPQHWVWERGYPQGNNLNDVAAVSPTAAFAVGDFGAIVHYSGTSGWSVQSSGVTTNLTGVALAGSTGAAAYVVGAGATVLRTVDTGATWSALTCTGCGSLTSVAFRTATVGVIAGTGGIRYTTDGLTFTLATGSVNEIMRLVMAPGSSTVVYALGGSGVVYKSSDNGASWVAGTAAVAGSTWYSLSVVSDTQVYVGGKGNNVYSNMASGTGTWSAMSPVPPIPFNIVDLVMTSTTSGYAIGVPTTPPPDTQFKVFTYSGSGWVDVNIGPQKTDVWPQALWASGTNLFIVGQGGMIFRSANGGATLSDDGRATGQRYFDVDVVDADHQVAAGAEGALSVGAFGIWNEYHCGSGNFQSVAAGSTYSVAVSDNGSVCWAANSALQTWSPGTGASGSGRRAVAWVGGTSFVSGGDDGLVWYSSNHGSTWASVDPDSAVANGINMLSTRPAATPEVWVGTNNMLLYKSSTPSSAGYVNATSALVPSPSTLTPAGTAVRGMSWLNDTTGFLIVSTSNGCGAGSGYVYRTTNQGNSWSRVASLPICTPCFGWKDIIALNATNAWVQGETCFAHVSSTDGSTFTYSLEQVPTPLPLLGLGGVPGSGELFMVGNYGAALHSHCGGSDTSTCTADTNTCTDDQCRPSDGVCVHPVNTNNACTDGNVCTLSDHCATDGSCVGTQKTCDDGNSCTNDSCNPVDAGCVFVASTSNTCSDGKNCTTGDACLADGGCKGTDVTCAPNTQCASNACDPGTGSCVATNYGSSVSCSDGLSCTINDVCNGAGGCVGTADCASPSVCLVASCQVDGGCGFTPVVGVVSCDDGNPCTVNDLCSGGVCSGTGTCSADGGAGDAGAGEDAGAKTDGGLANDGGAKGDAGVGDGGASDAGTTTPEPVFKPGCGCSAGGTESMLGVALLAWFNVRRRRSASR